MSAHSTLIWLQRKRPSRCMNRPSRCHQACPPECIGIAPPGPRRTRASPLHFPIRNLSFFIAARSAFASIDPSLDDVEGVPAVVGQDATARDGRFEAPVLRRRVARRSGAGPQGVPDDPRELADLAPPEELPDLSDDGRVLPVVDALKDATARGRKLRQRAHLVDRTDQGFLAQNVQASPKRAPDQRRVARRRRADVDEVDGGVGQQLVG